MRRDRNHEGYHDPTSGVAIRRVIRVSRRRSAIPKWKGLTYTLTEAEGFRKAVESMK